MRTVDLDEARSAVEAVVREHEQGTNGGLCVYVAEPGGGPHCLIAHVHKRLGGVLPSFTDAANNESIKTLNRRYGIDYTPQAINYLKEVQESADLAWYWEDAIDGEFGGNA